MPFSGSAKKRCQAAKLLTEEMVINIFRSSEYPKGEIYMQAKCTKLWMLFCTVLAAVPTVAMAQLCAPPSGFKDIPHPAVAPVNQLVSHTEEVTINQPLDVVLKESEQKSLNQAIRKSDSLPGVSGTYVLSKGDFGEPGSRRLVCLTDGSTTEEQVLQKDRSKTTAEFRYVVWNYTTEKARPILYGVGDFVWTDVGNGRTHVRWTYSFQLNRQRFPGYLGSVGDFLFRVGFLDRDYAKMMRKTLGKE